MKKKDLNAKITVRFFNAFEMRVSIKKSKIDQIWEAASGYFSTTEIDKYLSHTKRTLKLFLILVIRELYTISIELSIKNIMLPEAFRKKHPWYQEMEKSGLFLIEFWPFFDFSYEDFKIQEITDEPF